MMNILSPRGRHVRRTVELRLNLSQKRNLRAPTRLATLEIQSHLPPFRVANLVLRTG